MKTLSIKNERYSGTRITVMRLFSLGLSGLLLYTATKKVMDIEAFSAHLELLPYVGKTVAYMLTALVVLLEYGLAILILYRYRELWVYSLLLVLMMVYTSYIYYIMNYAPFLPCSCQGAFKNLSWDMHYVVNGIVAVASIMLWKLAKQQKKRKDETL
ncbi:hypothetical protein G5B00_02635 [Parapedobacter sp. SGR-10]|uniref:MauE/DoxX family redox-associated membrane protein n=1 Tax=Parapedobacter sp. SGR-10 TaxID=2710879 RepID=UPI0013D49800|nr:MauE/DoxX family redox-associated membrane protein [Parapedobacter sp. SGR-10]NGF55398.1 hypothetical protein [Parapedobacter sp. SGR-10]